MRDNNIQILHIPFANTTQQKLIEEINKRLTQEQKCFIVTANPEIVMYANKNENYKRAILTADYIVPDGIGVIIASKILQTRLAERIAGFDLMKDILKIANEHSYRVFLLGAKENVVRKTATNIQGKYPNVTIVGFHHGFFTLNDEKIVEMVKATQPDIIFVALGYPRQEQWIQQFITQFDKGLFIGVGGSFDVIAGKVKRAPSFWRKLNLEWLYRLLKQPSRWRRMLQLPLFLIEVILMRFARKNKN